MSLPDPEETPALDHAMPPGGPVTESAVHPRRPPSSEDLGRRRHYGEFYGLTALPDRPLFAVYGNCQAESLRILLHDARDGSGSRLGWHGVRMPPVHELEADDLPHLRRLLRRVSVLVSQPVAPGYRGLPLGTAEVSPLLPSDGRVVRFPVIRWTALMPTVAIVRAPGVGDPPVAPYHDLRVLAAAARGAGSVELEPAPSAAVRFAREDSLRQLRTRQEAHDTVDAAGVLEAAGGNAVHVINHPTNQVLQGVAQAVLDRLGLRASPQDPGRHLLGGILAPVATSTLDALGIPHHDVPGGPREHWTIGGREVSQREIADLHLRWYAEHPSVVGAGLARHRDMLRLLDVS